MTLSSWQCHCHRKSSCNVAEPFPPTVEVSKVLYLQTGHLGCKVWLQSHFLHNGGVTRASVHKSIDKKPDIIIHLNPAKEDAAKTVLWGKFLSMLPENPGAVGKKYLPLGKESRDNTASETSSARPGMCTRIHPGRDRDRWSGRHQIRKTRRATVTILSHIQLALRPEQLSTHKYVCVSATRSGKAR